MAARWLVGGDSGWLSDRGDSLLALLALTGLFLALFAAVVAATVAALVVVLLMLIAEFRLILLFVVVEDRLFDPVGGYSYDCSIVKVCEYML